MRIDYVGPDSEYKLANSLMNTINSIIQNGVINTGKKDTTISVFNNIFKVECSSLIWIPHIIAFNNEKVKNVSTKYALAEAAYILHGRNDCNIIEHFPFLEKYKQKGEMIGSYGPYFGKQLVDTIMRLKEEPYTRQAVISVWPINEPFKRSSECVDVPCTNYFAFYMDKILEYNVLNMTVVHRSSDALLGLTYDIVFQQILLQTVLLFLPNTYLDTITNIAVNRHIYLNNTGIFALNNDNEESVRNTQVMAISERSFDFANFILCEVLDKPYAKNGFESARLHIKDLTGNSYGKIQNIIYRVMTKLYEAAIDGSVTNYIS